MHLVLVQVDRKIPPIALNDLRIKRQMLEINADDLRFTHDEIKTFFNRTCDRCLTEVEINEIEEVYSRFPEEIQVFLKRTSILSRLGEASLHLLPDEDQHNRSESEFVLGSSYLDDGRPGDAEGLLLAALQKFQARNDPYMACLATASLTRGRLRQAEEWWAKAPPWEAA